MSDGREQYRQLIDLLVRECREGQGPIAARGAAADAYVTGVHDTLRVLHDRQVPPFEYGYEGTPFHDFMGRLDGWEWPER